MRLVDFFQHQRPLRGAVVEAVGDGFPVGGDFQADEILAEGGNFPLAVGKLREAELGEDFLGGIGGYGTAEKVVEFPEIAGNWGGRDFLRSELGSARGD